MPNLAQIISQHNAKLINKKKQQEQPQQKLCNCRVSKDCPMGNNCLKKSLIYQATVVKYSTSNTVTDQQTQCQPGQLDNNAAQTNSSSLNSHSTDNATEQQCTLQQPLQSSPNINIATQQQQQQQQQQVI